MKTPPLKNSTARGPPIGLPPLKNKSLVQVAGSRCIIFFLSTNESFYYIDAIFLSPGKRLFGVPPGQSVFVK